MTLKVCLLSRTYKSICVYIFEDFPLNSFKFDISYSDIPCVYSLCCYEWILWREMWWKATFNWLLINGFLQLVTVPALGARVFAAILRSTEEPAALPCSGSFIALCFQQLVTSNRVEMSTPICTHVFKTIPLWSCHSLIVHKIRLPLSFRARFWARLYDGVNPDIG